jgi:hypothetical protein
MQHRSIVEAIQDTDEFMYSERSAQNREGGGGARFEYICRDSLQNKDHKSNVKKEKSHDSDDGEAGVKKQEPTVKPTYDCGGAIHIKFSLKRDALNAVYKHNSIHTTRENNNRYVVFTIIAATGYFIWHSLQNIMTYIR